MYELTRFHYLLNSIPTKIHNCCQAPLAHFCNPSYSGGRHQEDCGLKPAQANSSQDPISEKPTIKKELVE
jgi:hypothetical protein